MNAVPCDVRSDVTMDVVVVKIEIGGAATKSSGKREVMARVDNAETKSGSVEDQWPGSQSRRAAGSNERTAAP